MIYLCLASNLKWHTKLVIGLHWDWTFSKCFGLYYTPDNMKLKAWQFGITLGPITFSINSEDNNELIDAEFENTDTGDE